MITTIVLAILVCVSLCYDVKNHAETKGYDPVFLKHVIADKTCLIAHQDLMKIGMPDLKYCSKELGTL